MDTEKSFYTLKTASALDSGIAENFDPDAYLSGLHEEWDAKAEEVLITRIMHGQMDLQSRVREYRG